MEWIKIRKGIWNWKTGLIAAAVILAAALRFELIMRWLHIALAGFIPLFIGLGVASLLNVPLRFVEEKLFAPLNRKGGKRWEKLRRPLALTLTFLIAAGLLLVLFVLVFPAIGEGVSILAEKLPPILAELKNRIQENRMLRQYSESFDPKAVSGWLKSWSQGNTRLWSDLQGAGTAALDGTINGVLGILFAAALLMKKETLCRQLKRVLYAFLPERAACWLVDTGKVVNQTFYRFFSGQILEAAIVGLLCFGGMLLFRFPYAGMVSALIGFGALIPIFGTWAGAVSGTVLILLQSPAQAVWFLVFLFVLLQLEGSVIHPQVIGESVGLPGIWAMLAVIAGGTWFGFFGVLLMVPVFAVIYRILRKETETRLGKKLSPDIET